METEKKKNLNHCKPGLHNWGCNSNWKKSLLLDFAVWCAKLNLALPHYYSSSITVGDIAIRWTIKCLKIISREWRKLHILSCFFIFVMIKIPTEKWTSKSTRSCYIFKVPYCQTVACLASLAKTGVDSTAYAVATIPERVSYTIFQEGHSPSHFPHVISTGNATGVSCENKDACSSRCDEKSFQRGWSGQWLLLPGESWTVLLVFLFLYIYVKHIKQVHF